MEADRGDVFPDFASNLEQGFAWFGRYFLPIKNKLHIICHLQPHPSTAASPSLSARSGRNNLGHNLIADNTALAAV
jgi:hypothetical protein